MNRRSLVLLCSLGETKPLEFKQVKVMERVSCLAHHKCSINIVTNVRTRRFPSPSAVASPDLAPYPIFPLAFLPILLAILSRVSFFLLHPISSFYCGHMEQNKTLDCP